MNNGYEKRKINKGLCFEACNCYCCGIDRKLKLSSSETAGPHPRPPETAPGTTPGWRKLSHFLDGHSRKMAAKKTPKKTSLHDNEPPLRCVSTTCGC